MEMFICDMLRANILRRHLLRHLIEFESFANILLTLVNNRIVDYLEKCGLFSNFQYSLKSSQSTADLLTVASDRIARVFYRCGTFQAVAFDISKAFACWSSSQT